MSKRKDRERAENGLLYRNGGLVAKKLLRKRREELEEEASPAEARQMIRGAYHAAGIPEGELEIEG